MNKNIGFLLIALMSASAINGMGSDFLPQIIITNAQARNKAQKHAHMFQKLVQDVTNKWLEQNDYCPGKPLTLVAPEYRRKEHAELHKTELTGTELLEGARVLRSRLDSDIHMMFLMMRIDKSYKPHPALPCLTTLRKEIKHLDRYIHKLEQ